MSNNIFAQAKNALTAGVRALSIHNANISNLNTIGYKPRNYSFATVLNEVMQGAVGPSSNYGGQNPFQLSDSISISGIKLDFAQANLIEGTALDLAIDGNGLMLVSPDNGSTFYYTRAGRFRTDSQGYLVDSMGRKLAGYKMVGDVADTSTLVPIKNDGYTDIGWGDNGILVGNYTAWRGAIDAGTTPPDPIPLYQVALSDFNNKSGLLEMPGTCYKETLASGQAFTPGIPRSASYGLAKGQRLEKSGTNYIGESFDVSEVQAMMNASQSMAKAWSDMVSSFINKISS